VAALAGPAVDACGVIPAGGERLFDRAMGPFASTAAAAAVAGATGGSPSAVGGQMFCHVQQPWAGEGCAGSMQPGAPSPFGPYAFVPGKRGSCQTAAAASARVCMRIWLVFVHVWRNWLKPCRAEASSPLALSLWPPVLSVHPLCTHSSLLLCWPAAVCRYPAHWLPAVQPGYTHGLGQHAGQLLHRQPTQHDASHGPQQQRVTC
jgi:hypothetical protein